MRVAFPHRASYHAFAVAASIILHISHFTSALTNLATTYPASLCNQTGEWSDPVLWSVGCARTNAVPLVSGGKQLPVPLGDDFDSAVDHADGGLIVDGI